MQLDELAMQIGAQIHTPGRGTDVERDQVYAGDRISDLLNAAGDHALLVTNLASEHLIRVAELMDIPGLCLVCGQVPSAEMVATARQHGTLIMTSPASLFETCGRVHRCLVREHEAAL